LDDISPETFELGLSGGKSTALLNVVPQYRHAPLHHLVVLIVANAGHDPFLLLGDWQRVQSGPHVLGDAHHVVDHDLVEKPHLPAEFRNLEEVGVQSYQGILDVVDALFNKNELKDGQNVYLYIGDGLWSNRRFYDSGDGFQATSSC